MARQTRLFISYSRADSLFLEQLVPLLEQVFPDYEIWYDKHITGGDDWWRRILAEIDRCDLFVYLISNESLTSEYCQAEFREMLRLQKPCLPILVRPKTDIALAPKDLEGEIRRRNWIDLSGGFNQAQTNAALFRAVRLQTSETSAERPAPLRPEPTSLPAVDHSVQPTAQNSGRRRLIALLVGVAALILFTLFEVVGLPLTPPQKTATRTPTATATVATAAAMAPTLTATVVPTLSPTLIPATTAPPVSATFTATTATAPETATVSTISHFVPLSPGVFVGHTKGVNSAALSPDSRYVVTASDDFTAVLWDAQTTKQIRSFHSTGAYRAHDSYAYVAAFSPDSRYVLTGGADHAARLWDVQTGTLFHDFTNSAGSAFKGSIWAVAFSPDGKYIAIGSTSDDTSLYDAQTFRPLPITRLTGVRALAFSADSTYLAVGTDDPTTYLLKTSDATTAVRTFDYSSAVRSIAFSPYDQRIAIGYDDATIQMWNAETGESIGSFTGGHTQRIRSVSFSPNGKFLLTGSEDTTGIIWDVSKRSILKKFGPYQSTRFVNSVAFSQDGKLVLLGLGNWTAQFVDSGMETG